MNPNMEIYFLFATKSDGISMKYSDLIDALVSYPNIHLRFLNPIQFSQQTPLENFFMRDELSKSKYPIEHTADVLRILTLYKFGGLYLDLDVVSVVPYKKIEKSLLKNKNFACLGSTNELFNGILKFDVDSGRKVTEYYLK